MSERAKTTTKTSTAKSKNPFSQVQKSASIQSINSPVDQVLNLQSTIGNQTVQRLFNSGVIQAKLKIGPPGDIYEQEADRIADKVMRRTVRSSQKAVGNNENTIQKKEEEFIQPKPLADQITPFVQRQVEEEEEEEETLQAKPLVDQITPLIQRQIEEEEEEEEEFLQTKAQSSQVTEVTSNIESRIQSLKGGGQPLPESICAYFEPRFGRDFSQVRIHNDAYTAEVARAINARAFTFGQNIGFASLQYNPGSMIGKKLLAHELVHIIQQKMLL
jgi:hypothetical protein